MLGKCAATLALTVFASIPLPNWAVEEFPLSANLAARKRINDFLDPDTKTTGLMHEIKKLEVQGLPAIHLLLDIALERVADDSTTDGVRRRVGSLLGYAAEIAHNSANDKSNPELIAAIGKQAETLLEHYRARGGVQQSVVSIYDSFSFWTAKDFWFFMQFARNTQLLVEYHNQIQKLIPQIGDQQLDDFATKLRSIRPYNLVPLSLLLDTGRMTERELTLLFKLAADRYAKRHTSNLDEPHQSWRWAQTRDRAVAPTLARLVEALRQENPLVVSAFNKAKRHAEAQGPSWKSNLLNEFFVNVLNDRLDSNFTTWRPGVRPIAIAQPGDPPPRELPDYKVEDNVILVDFKYEGRCTDDLDKEI